jgi:hypothetical protein
LIHRALLLPKLVLTAFDRGVHLQVALVRSEEVERLEQRVLASATISDLLAGLVAGVDLLRDDPLRGL